MYDRTSVWKGGICKMICREAETLVIPYINHELTDEKMAEFLEHIENCENCREELEIYYTVAVGIQQLDTDTGTGFNHLLSN